MGEPVTASLSAAAVTAGASAPGVGLVGGPRPGSLSTGGGRWLGGRAAAAAGWGAPGPDPAIRSRAAGGSHFGWGLGWGRGGGAGSQLDGITAGCGRWGSVASACGLAGCAGPGSLSLEEASLGVVGGGRGWSEPNEPTASTGTSKYFWSCKHLTQTSPTLRMVSSMRPPAEGGKPGGALSQNGLSINPLDLLC